MQGLALTQARYETLARGLLALLAGWLAWTLLRVNIDLDDGYATIVNAQYFLGVSDYYIFIRGPLMGLLLTPAEWLANRLGLHPFDVRPHHALMALAHFGYLVGVWRMLVRTHGCDRWTLIAFIAAVPTVVFFSYAPYISHDLFPGLLALWLVWLSHRQLSRPAPATWLALVVLGTALALIKQTYALVFIAVVLAQPLLVWTAPERPPLWLRRWASLAVAALVSGILTWAIYAMALAVGFGDEPFWIRPLKLIELVGNIYLQEGGNRAAFFQGLYLRNLWAYGILAMTLVLPAAVLAMRHGTDWERRVALVWLLLMLALLLTPQKETRYLAFLAPFNALLLVPLMRWIAARRAWFQPLAWLLLALDLFLAGQEALRLRDPWYQHAVTGFLAPLPQGAGFSGRLIMGAPLAFVAPDQGAFFGDRYHRITHVSLESVSALYGIPPERLVRLPVGSVVKAEFLQAGDWWAMANQFVARTRPFVGGNFAGLQQGFEQFLVRAERIDLDLDGKDYRVRGEPDGAPLILLGPGGAGRLVGSARFDGDQLRALTGAPAAAPSVSQVGLRVLRLCTLAACQDRWPPPP